MLFRRRCLSLNTRYGSFFPQYETSRIRRVGLNLVLWWTGDPVWPTPLCRGKAQRKITSAVMSTSRWPQVQTSSLTCITVNCTWLVCHYVMCYLILGPFQLGAVSPKVDRVQQNTVYYFTDCTHSTQLSCNPNTLSS